MNFLDVYPQARAFLFRGWTRGALARNAAGAPVSPHDPSAVCWCVLGALDAALGSGHSPEDAAYAAAVLKRTNGIPLEYPFASYNDREERTQEEMIHLFDVMLEELSHHRAG